jgi:glycolate oxidase FAD binding subunit
VIRASLQPAPTARAAALVERARETAGRFGGFVVVEAAPHSYKREHDVFGSPASDFAIMRRLKEEFDPKRILSSGRFVGRL